MKNSACIILYLLLSLLLTSCHWEGDDDIPAGGEGKYLSFILQSEFSGSGETTRSTPDPVTRGTVPGEDVYFENLIDFNGTNKDLHIFFFDYTNSSKCLFYPVAERLSLTTNENGDKVLNIKLAPEAGDLFGNLDPNDMIGQNTILYVVANSGLGRAQFLQNGADPTNENSLVKPLAEIRQTVIEAQFNRQEGTGIKKQQKFVMEAERNVYIPVWSDVTTVSLKRAASKIQMGLYSVSVPGYTAESAEVQLVNYTERSHLSPTDGNETFVPSENDYLNTPFFPVTVSPAGTPPSTASYTEPFYSYPSDWSADPDKAAYLLLKINWKKDSDQSTRDYYYKIPLSYIPSDTENGAAFRNRLRRNYIYRYLVTVTALGGNAPATAPEIGGNFDIIEWGDFRGDGKVEVTIQKFDWLFVEEQNVVIYPQGDETYAEYLIPYRSSSPLSMTIAPTVTYEKYDENGNVSTQYYTVGDEQYITYDLNYTPGTSGQRYIYIRSKVPDKYVPKYVYFRVNNDALLYANINITHYPPIYVTSMRSNSNNANNLTGGRNQGSNYNLYVITTLALTGNENFDWAWDDSTSALRQKNYSIGDPKDASTGQYLDNADNAWVVSPKFIIQSSRGRSSSVVSISEATSRCKGYQETTTSGAVYAPGSWRLPTMAEMYLIYKLNSDTNSAVNNSLNSSGWQARIWTAGSYLLTSGQNTSGNGTVFQMIDANLGEGTKGSGMNAKWSVRGFFDFGYWHVPVCVRDYYQE